MEYLPENKDICELTSFQMDEQREKGISIIPCIVEVEYQNDYCWLVRYTDNDQCNMILKSDTRFYFKEI